jgi:2-oxoglutarate ferredoxin oxidoreductase subunit alpha
MTCTSGPGISLMGEFVGFGYYAEIPAVIFDVQRVGPSTGLPTRTAQGDVLSTAFLSHGDTKHPMLFPGSVEECFSMAIEAFDLAERLQTPVFVMSDLDLGMNNWMAEPFPYPEKPLDRGKVLTAEEVKTLGGFHRYQDVDGDGIGYRTLPGTPHPLAGYFTRGSGHNEKAKYSERADDYVNNLDRLSRKWETARALVPDPEFSGAGKTDVGIIAYGSSHWAVLETLDQLRLEHDLNAGYCRVRAFPFKEEVKDFIRRHRRVYVVDQNRDAQLCQLLRLEVEAAQVKKLRSVRHYDGLPIDARSVTDSIIAQEEEN